MAVVIGKAASATAAPVTFTCAAVDTASCNGSTYALTLTSVGETSPGVYTYELLFGVETAGYTGASTDFLQAIAFKNIVDNFGNVTLIDAPAGVDSWDLFFTGLNGNGCTGGNSSVACVKADPALNGGYGVPVAPGPQFFWTFRFESTDGTPNATGHIKYLYVSEDGKKVGSLGSFDTSLQQVAQNEASVLAPEPGTLLLFAVGAMIAVRQRSRSAG